MDLGGGRSVLEREELGACVRQHKADVAGKRDRRGRLAGAGRSSGPPGARGDGPREGQLIEVEANLLFSTRLGRRPPAPGPAPRRAGCGRRRSSPDRALSGPPGASLSGWPTLAARIDSRSKSWRPARLGAGAAGRVASRRGRAATRAARPAAAGRFCTAALADLSRGPAPPRRRRASAARVVAKKALCWRGAKAATKIRDKLMEKRHCGKEHV